MQILLSTLTDIKTWLDTDFLGTTDLLFSIMLLGSPASPLSIDVILTPVISTGLKFKSIYNLVWQNPYYYDCGKQNNRNQLMVNFARLRFEFEKLIPKSWTMVYGNQNIQK